jgi:DNA-binding transcriptional LysR family regulator
VLIPPSLSPHVLPQALKQFRRKYRTMPLSIRTLHSRDIVTALGLREGDLGIVYGTHPHPGVVETPVATGHLMCLMAGAPARRKTITLAELSGQPVIRIHPQDPIGFVLNDMTTRLGVRFVGGITVQTYQSALSLAEYGFGPAIVDEFTLGGRQYRHLKALRVEPAVPVQLNALRPVHGDELAASAYLTECIRSVAQDILGHRSQRTT